MNDWARLFLGAMGLYIGTNFSAEEGTGLLAVSLAAVRAINAVESNGYTPAALNPAQMFYGIIASAQARENKSENWNRVTTFPGLFVIYW